MSNISVVATFVACAVAASNLPAIAASHSNTLDGSARLKVQSSPVYLQKYGGADPHGDDPHGDDPKDEQHDSKLPANKDRDQGKAPKDVYGGQYPNGQQPY